MLHILRKGDADFCALSDAEPDTDLNEAVWIDLKDPTKAEESRVEALLGGVDLPTREEMSEIKASSRLYQEGGAAFMTANLLCHDGGHFTSPVTFVLCDNRLITIRYTNPDAFQFFADEVRKHGAPHERGAGLMAGLLEAIIDRTADLLDRTAEQVHHTAAHILGRTDEKTPGFQRLIRDLGDSQIVYAKARDSLFSLGRLIGYAHALPTVQEAGQADTMHSLQRDVQSLTDHVSYEAANIQFLLDAALGLVNIEQNNIMKTFSVAAVVLMPPTLAAGVWGMNFKHMPELEWAWGYPMALGVIVLLTLIPIVWFRKKGWF